MLLLLLFVEHADVAEVQGVKVVRSIGSRTGSTQPREYN
jgi:hypothetical protein